MLRTLAEEQQSSTLSDLTKTVLKNNHQTSTTAEAEDVLADIRRSLYHVHLPKLASAGLIDYDPERQLVKRTEQFDQVKPTLSTILAADPTLEATIES